MFRQTLLLACLFSLAGLVGRAEPGREAPPALVPPARVLVYVIPVRETIAEPVLYIVRRGLKEASAQHAGVVVIDMHTLGGAADVALEMMEALGKYPGQTMTYVNNQAMSAGAFIAASTQEIWFAPDGIIGAAAAVTSEGQDIPETMRLKLTSFLRAKIRAVSEGRGYRGDVLAAMIDKDFELKIGDQVIKPKGELLSLTATEAAKAYGTPSQPLLSAGTAKSLDELLAKKFGAGNYDVVRGEVTWSENLAVWLNTLSPVLLGLGMLALFIEFKTPGFGLFGVIGIVLLAVVFLSSSVAGLSGHEPMVVFALGVILVALELAFFHTAGFLGVVGVMLIGGSLIWAMADIWPNQPVSVAWSSDLLVRPVVNLGLGVVIAVVLAGLLVRYLPKGWVWDRIVLREAVVSAAQSAGAAPNSGMEELTGRSGVVVTPLRPGGEVEIDGHRYQAQLALGSAAAGDKITVTGRSDFGLTVEKISS